MLCRICGSPVKEGEKFCSLCGTKTEVTESTYRDQAQQPYSRQPDNQQQYGQQESRQSYRREESRQSYQQQPNNQQPYGRQSGQYFDQPYGQQPKGNMYYSSDSAKSKKGLWITLCLVAVLAIAAVLIFTVLGDQLTANSQGTPPPAAPPFKGDTLQTKFANDTAKVMSNAFDIFENVGIDLNKLAEQPFDIKLDTTIKGMGEKANLNIDAAYDNETFGVNMNAEGSSIKMLLIEDIWYMEMFGGAVGVDINTTADLSGPMALKDRLAALVEGAGFPQSTSGEGDYTVLAGLLIQSTISGGEYTPLAELLLNSIDESCFVSGDSKTTLTLHADDVADALRTFAGRFEDNEELKKSYEDFIKESSGVGSDVIKQLGDAADALEAQKETSELEIVWDILYKNEKPASFEIKADDGDQKYVYSFGYEQSEAGTNVTFELTSGNTSGSVSGTCTFKKAGPGTEFTGSIITQGEIMTFYGNIAFSGNNTHGTITISLPDSSYMAYGQQMEISFDFNLTLNIGMPPTKVRDDGRFYIDTSGADIIDGSSMPETYGLPGLY